MTQALYRSVLPRSHVLIVHPSQVETEGWRESHVWFEVCSYAWCDGVWFPLIFVISFRLLGLGRPGESWLVEAREIPGVWAPWDVLADCEGLSLYTCDSIWVPCVADVSESMARGTYVIILCAYTWVSVIVGCVWYPFTCVSIAILEILLWLGTVLVALGFMTSCIAS